MIVDFTRYYNMAPDLKKTPEVVMNLEKMTAGSHNKRYDVTMRLRSKKYGLTGRFCAVGE